MKRVVDIPKVHSAVLVHSISRAAHELYSQDVDINKLVAKAVEMHNEVKKLKTQLAAAPPGTQEATTIAASHDQ